jgi:hypothetical protein
MKKSRQRGLALVGLLIAVALIAVAVVVIYGRKPSTPPPTRPGGPTTTLGQSMEKGTEVACMNNLRQIRDAISMERLNDPNNAAPPPNLQALQKDGISPTMLACPVTHQPYRYDPATGRVACVTPGHEKF